MDEQGGRVEDVDHGRQADRQVADDLLAVLFRIELSGVNQADELVDIDLPSQPA